MYVDNRPVNDKTLYIHIGMNKTGSSSIQETLQTSLDDSVWEYIKIGSPNHGGAMLVMFKKDFYSSKLNKASETRNEIETRKKNIANKLIDKIRNSNKKKFILSGETILLLSETELEEMRDFFQRLCGNIIILGYVRSPASFNQSAFQQRLKSFNGQVNIHNVYPMYEQLFEKFYHVFGISNVLLWKFDPKKFPENDVVVDFCQKLGFQIQKKSIKRVNESLTREAIALLYVYRKFYPELEIGKKNIRENEKLIDYLRGIGSSKFKVSSKLMQPIIDEHSKDIAWMEQRLGESLREVIDNENAIDSERDLEEIAIKNVYELEKYIDKKWLSDNIHRESVEGVAQIVRSLRLMIKETDNLTLTEELKVIAHNSNGLKTNCKSILSCVLSLFKKVILLFKYYKWKKIIEKSGRFDYNFYLMNNPDVEALGIDPVIHYLQYGAQEGRNPNSEFNTNDYCKHTPDIQNSNINPFVHYLLYEVGKSKDNYKI